METIDPATGAPLPEDAIQRVLFLAPAVHVYNIPPLASTKGYMAAAWTADGNQRQIFTARTRVIETAYESDENNQQLKVDVILEDPSNGQLFAAAPYTSAAIVEPVLDSSRFFAIRVQDGQGRKAILGIGFEERSEAFDFGVSLQEARKSLGIDGSGDPGGPPGKANKAATAPAEEKRDYSLKEGETITVNLGGRFGRKKPQEGRAADPPPGASLNSFALPPPPGSNSLRGTSGSSSGTAFLPPPPSAQDVRAQKKNQAAAMGFDDGKFGEFA
jgi:adaptin ear-binding coat-associated protein 1/2